MCASGKTLAQVNVVVPIAILGVRSTAVAAADAYALQQSMWGRHAAEFARVLGDEVTSADVAISVEPTDSSTISATVNHGNACKSQQLAEYVEEVLTFGFGRPVAVFAI